MTEYGSWTYAVHITPVDLRHSIELKAYHPAYGTQVWDSFFTSLPARTRTQQGILSNLWVATIELMERCTDQP